jgi:hypothetical protein
MLGASVRFIITDDLYLSLSGDSQAALGKYISVNCVSMEINVSI